MKIFSGIKIGLCLLLPIYSLAQEPVDTLFRPVDSLENVTVHGFEFGRKSRLSAAVVKIITLNDADLTNKTSLVQSLNSVAGVRMEERSPGSYRINIRGSSLRSPFGVRNVKVYWNDIPLTDAGGNTYFNQIAYNNFGSINIYKGPAGSLYGAGTGGLITMQPNWKKKLKLEYVTGSYHLHNIFFDYQFGSKENQNSISYAHNQSDGYRDHTRMRRDNASWNATVQLSKKQILAVHVLYTNLFYETPGGLTLAQFTVDPKAARPSGGGLPGAEAAKAAIYQNNFLAGLTSSYFITGNWTNKTMLYASYAQIKNPSIRNYEQRSEPNIGGRTSFDWEKKTGDHAIKWSTGIEYQEGFFNTKVSTNNNGNIGSLQTDDDIRLTTGFLFSQLDFVWKDTWFISTGASLNKNKVGITRVNVNPVINQSRNYRTELAPRIALLKKFKDVFSIGAVVSRGYSPPTISELLPSTSIVNTGLNAEHGINYEANFKWQLLNNRLFLELTAYHFALKDALVQRRDSSGADYYVNAGGTHQNGIEFSSSYSKSFHHLLDYIYFKTAYSYSHYRYHQLKKDTADFNGNRLPGIPQHSFSIVGNIAFKHGFYTNFSAYLASAFFLNDANTDKADAYELLGCRIGWRKQWQNLLQTDVHAGADNLLNKKYSLGNDLNDPRGRYYNAAPARNFYIGIAFSILPKTR